MTFTLILDKDFLNGSKLDGVAPLIADPPLMKLHR